MRRTIIARTPDEIFLLRNAWQRLEKQPSATMFQSFEWNYLAARVFVARVTPHVILCETDDGVALLPAAIDTVNSRTTLLGENLFDYRDILNDCNVTHDHAIPSCWGELSRLGMKFSAAAIRSDSAIAAWDGMNLNNFHGAPRVCPSEISAAQFAAQHGRLGRWKRRLEREGIHFHCHHGDNSALVRFIYEQKALQPSDNGENLFRDPLRQEFLIQICAAMGNNAEIFTLESAGGLIAALVTFRDRHVRRCYTIYFHQAWFRYSPGMVLLYEVTCRSLEAGIECDYMTGEHPYKMRFATSLVPMYWAEASANALSSTQDAQMAKQRIAS